MRKKFLLETLKYICVSLMFVPFIFVSGCMVLPVEDLPPPAPVVQLPQAQAFRTGAVMRGDVVRYFNPIASYVPSREEALSFDMEGHRIMGIYVDIGDYVQVGDVVASLYWPQIQAQLETALRQEEWARLNLSHLDRRQQHARTQGTLTSEESARFRQDRQRLEHELDILEKELEYLTSQNQRRYLRAGMDGTVARTVFFEEGMLSNPRVSVVTIVDQTYSLFVVRHSQEDLTFNYGDYYTLYVNRIPQLAVVIDPDTFGVERAPVGQSEVYLTFAGEPPVLTGRPTASLHVVLETVEDVLFVPLRSVYHGSERVFVYVLEDGVRRVRDVEIGIRGNAAYEIISGLEEGELVIIG